MDDRKKMMQMLLPAAAAAGVILLIGVLIATSNQSTEPTGKEKKAEGNPPFPLDSAEWKEVPGAEGLKAWDLKEGTGTPVPSGATVTIHYTGWTTDGTVFDSTRKDLSPRPTDGSPATFPLGNLIQGWQLGIPGMKPGGVRRLMIPYQLGYGERGDPPTIPPRATLLFEIELVSAK